MKWKLKILGFVLELLNDSVGIVHLKLDSLEGVRDIRLKALRFFKTARICGANMPDGRQPRKMSPAFGATFLP